MPAHVKAVAAVIVLAALGATPVHAQRADQDPQLIARLLDGRFGPSYDLSAEFTGTLMLAVGGGRYRVTAAGVLRETYRSGETRRVDATVLKVQVPLILRPAATAIAAVVEQWIEAQAEDAGSLRTHDVVILEERRDGRYYLGGIRRDIVDEAIARYQSGADPRDPTMRRAVAAWLLTAPGMRARIRRAGPPYAFAALIDERGHLHEASVSYDWGEVANTVSYTTVQEIAAWRQLTLHVSGQVAGLGEIVGRLEMQFGSHRVTR